MTGNDNDYRLNLHIDAPPAAVAHALTDADEIARWWTSWDTVTGNGAEGGRLHFALGRPDQLVMDVAAARPTVVAWDVVACPVVPDWTGTRPTFTFDPSAVGGTDVRFHHVGLSVDLECFGICYEGWNRHLTALVTYVADSVRSALTVASPPSQ